MLHISWSCEVIILAICVLFLSTYKEITVTYYVISWHICNIVAESAEHVDAILLFSERFHQPILCTNMADLCSPKI